MIDNIRKRKLFCNIGVYTTGHILNAAIPFFLMPVLTRYLSPEDYGITAMLAVLVGIYTPFIGLNTQGLVAVAYFKEKLDFSLVVSAAFALLFISVMIVTFVTIMGADIIASLSQYPVSWLWVVIIICFTNFFVVILQNIQQVKGKAKGYTAVQLGQTSVNLVLSLIFVVLVGMNWQGRIWAQVITGFAFMIVASMILYRWRLLKWKFSLDYIRNSLAFGLPLIPHALCGYIVVAADRIFISQLVGVSELGIFSVGYSLGQVIELLGTSFNKAYSPWLYEKLKGLDEGRSNNRFKIVKYSYACVVILLLATIIYSLSAPYLMSFWVGPKFQAASKYILCFSLAAVIHAMYYLVVNYIFYRQKTQYLAIITFGSSVLHVGITYMMIKTWGAIGAAYAAVVTELIMLLLTWLLSNKIYPMPWLLWRD